MLNNCVEIVHMERVDDGIHVKGILPDVYDLQKGTFYVTCRELSFPVQFTVSQDETKTSGEGLCRHHPFEFFLRLEDLRHQRISFIYADAEGTNVVPLTFSTHDAKLSNNVKNAYWSFASMGTQYLMTYNEETLLISRVGYWGRKRQEQRLRGEMLFSHNRAAVKKLLFRMAYFLFGTFLRRHPIWVFFDGTSRGACPAGAFYRYTMEKNDSIRKYYVDNRGAPDNNRLRKDGFRLLKQNSLLLRLISLYADLIIVSRSGADELVEIPATQSVFLRDLVNIHAVCLPDGRKPHESSTAQADPLDLAGARFYTSIYELEASLHGCPQQNCAEEDTGRGKAGDCVPCDDPDNRAALYDILIPCTNKLEKEKRENRFRNLIQSVRHAVLEGNILYGKLQRRLKLNPKTGIGYILRAVDRRGARLIRKSYFKNEPIRKNRVFMITYDSNFICNPKYIAEEIIRRKIDMEIFWAIPQNGKIDRNVFPKEIHLVRRNSEPMLRAMATSRVWIENAIDVPLHGIPKRPDQVFINTWHGSLGIKRLSGNAAWIKRAYKTGKMTDYCMTNSTFEEEVFRTTFWPDTPFLKYGHARNDLFFHPAVMDEKRRHVLETYRLPEDRKLFLYAPTFREDGMSAYENVDMDRLYLALTERFGGEWTILVRWHHKERERKLSSVENSHVVDASNFGDMQELLPAIDAGMSDYSSWVFDFILTGRPIFLFAPDVRDYDQARGFYYPIESTPFPIAHSNQELEQRVLGFDAGKYAADVKTFLDEKGCYEDGHAAERIVDFIEELYLGDRRAHEITEAGT